MHVIEKDIRKWSKEVLEIPSKELNNLPACPYAKQVWKNETYKFDINDKFNTLKDCVNKFVNGNYNKYQIVIWTSYEYPDSQQYFEGYLEYDQEEQNEYAMVFVQKLSEVNQASKDLEKKGYYKNFPIEIYNSLILDRRRLQNGYES